MPPRLGAGLTHSKCLFYVHRSAIPSPELSRGIGTIQRTRRSRYNEGPGLPVLSGFAPAALERKAKTLPWRTGALAVKKGMTALYDTETGKRTACTILQLERVQVVSHKTLKRHGYFAVQIGGGWRPARNVTKPELGHFAVNGVSPKRHMVEFRVKDATGLARVGMTIGPSWFKEGQFVDARADCKGKGFAGGMKRHGFAGQPASHGASLSHRAMGSSGGSQGSGSRVHPGKKMAGRMGGHQVTVQGSKVLKVDDENGLVVIAGGVAGPKGGIVKIQDSIKHPFITPSPDSYDSPSAPAS